MPCSLQKHFYQPGFTLVGGGIFKLEHVCRLEKDVLPVDRVRWIREDVQGFEPGGSAVTLRYVGEGRGRRPLKL